MILINHLDKGNFNPAFYWSLEQYVLNNLIKQDDIFFFTWKVKGTISGKNQVIENEVNLAYVKENNINVYRRPSGGGTVYADENNLMFTIAKKKNVNISFEEEIKLIVGALNDYGINAKFSGRNDILVDEKKISGNSFFINKNGMIIHGTLLFDTDIQTMVRAITPSVEKLVSKGIESVRSRVTNISKYTNASLDEFRNYLEKSLTKSTYKLSNDELDYIIKDSKRYLSKTWIYGEQPLHTKVIKEKFSYGELILSINISYAVIKSIRINGDFFELEPVSLLEEKLTEIPLTTKDIKERLSQIDIGKYIINAKTKDLINLLNKAVVSE